MRRSRLAVPFVSALMLMPSLLVAVDVEDTRLLSDPALSEERIAFAYAGDLWLAELDGSGVRRLTSHEGSESSPSFSPDGGLLAFSAEYEGNLDVYVVSAEGGVPTRLTWHPARDQVEGFSADGKRVLFSSSRQVFTNRYRQLFEVPVAGGPVERLPIPNGLRAEYSPDGRFIAYIPVPERFQQWKNYRGGTASRIWIYDTADHSVLEVPQPDGRCNDTDPVWLGARVFFRSDRNGEFNVFAFDPDTLDLEQLTFFDDFPINRLAGWGDRLIFEQAGYLHLLELSSVKPERLRIGVAADLVETRPRYATGNFIRSAALSPSGARAVFGFRGEIVTVPAEKGDPRNLTRSPAAHERTPIWSPDGSRIAYFSDASGEYALHVVSQDGRGAPRVFELGGEGGGAGFYEDPKWSPDGKWISYTDNSWALFVIDVESGEIVKVGSEYRYGPLKTLHHSWSPDSRWLAYTLNTAAYIQKIWVYSIDDGNSYPITDGLSEVGEPVFDRSGKYLYFFASTDAGPMKQWFAMSNADAAVTRSIYIAVLARGVPSPLAKESDEEEGDADQAAPAEAASEDSGDPESKGDVVLDRDGLNHRILALPVATAGHTNLQAGEAGKVYYVTRPSLRPGPGGGGAGTLKLFDLKSREEKALLEGVESFSLSADGKRILYRQRGKYAIAAAGGEISSGKGQLAADDIEVKIDPRAEWGQIFDEAWRINRDYFYDPNMHGADWPAMREKYRAFLPHLATRQDLNRVLRWMCSELAVGHHRVFGGDSRVQPKRVSGGLLGADFQVIGGSYRVSKVLGGLNWNPELRSPLTEPGVDVREGEYIIAVNGERVTASDNLYRFFENTAGKIVEMTVGPDPSGAGSRVVEVVPIEDESRLRNRDWVEGNLRRVEAATGGRVAYVYVPNTSTLGHTYFKRYFFPQVNKDAIIIDERFNGGGQVADYYIDHLRRPYVAHWATRYGADLETPAASIRGPKVMLIDETAGSGGDLLPWMFRKFGMGPLIGKRTWGGLVGILGFPVLMDGGRITAPNLAIWNENGFVVENVGVPPDIEVERWPAEVIAGRDPQLEKAIEVILELLEKDPPEQPVRPPYPVRVRR